MPIPHITLSPFSRNNAVDFVLSATPSPGL
jgi:hypothetical protein